MRASFDSALTHSALRRPGPRQSSRLLQLSSSQFAREIRAAVAANPFLEADGVDDVEAEADDSLPLPVGPPSARTAAPQVVPDVVVRRDGGDWRVEIHASLQPCARLNQAYADALRVNGNLRSDEAARQLQQARWLLRSAERRLATIRRVAQAIVAHQHEFFERGEIALKPLALRNIAAELGLHESTISRASGNKYMSTPRGIYEFRHFFSRELPTRDGDTRSAASVRALIAQMIADERSDAPLSDVALADLLSQRGVRVARRTVSKYRCMLGLPPVDARTPAKESLDVASHRH
ncbi:MAG: hypothetical protein AB7L76_00040 [Burkholderiaceae bacterium]